MGRSRTSKSLQCGVCGDNASVHKHYGSQAHVCFSCRAFFRRVNKVKKYPESTLCNSFLTQVGSCPITKRTRAFCSYCRYQKCIRVGMKNDFVMTKEDVEEMKAKAEDVKKTGIPSKLLVPTLYQLRTKSMESQEEQTVVTNEDTFSLPDLLDIPIESEMSVNEWIRDVDVEYFLQNI